MRLTRTAALVRRTRRRSSPAAAAAQTGPGLGRHAPPGRRAVAGLRPIRGVRDAGRAAAHHRRPVARVARQRRAGRPRHHQRRARQRHAGGPGVLRPPHPEGSRPDRVARDAGHGADRRLDPRLRRSTKTMSLATIVYACDAVLVGDYLEPFTLPVPWCRAPRRRASRNATTTRRVLPGKDRRRTYGAGDFIVIDRGTRPRHHAGLAVRRLPRQERGTGTSSTRSPRPWPSTCARTRPR